VHVERMHLPDPTPDNHVETTFTPDGDGTLMTIRMTLPDAKTRAAMLANVLGFWLLGMPVSLWLGFGSRLGVTGLWWGFVAGLGAVALFLTARVRTRLTGELSRLQLERSAV